MCKSEQKYIYIDIFFIYAKIKKKMTKHEVKIWEILMYIQDQ